ncbi:MAG: hypothetical protein Q9222_006779 [Ikaeria aurantiellina]
MLTFRVVRVSCRKASPYFQGLQFHGRWTRLRSSTAISKFDALAIEAKWKAKWAVKDLKKEHSENDYTPLSPLPYSILAVRKWCNNEEGLVRESDIRDDSMFDRLLTFATPRESSQFLKLSNDDPKIRECIHRQRELLWLLALNSTKVSHAIKRPSQKLSDDVLYEANMETWDEHAGDEITCLVHQPPCEPDILDHHSEEDSDGLWLVAQKTLTSLKHPTRTVEGLRRKQSLLTKLANKLVAYEDDFSIGNTIYHDAFYHSARILIHLTAPLAPAFAEECWVILHYGPPRADHRSASEKSDETAIEKNEEQKEENDNEDEAEEDEKTPSLDEIEYCLEDEEDYRHLPKRGHPETLPSIFEMPSPVPASKDMIKILKHRVRECEREKAAEEAAEREECW